MQYIWSVRSIRSPPRQNSWRWLAVLAVLAVCILQWANDRFCAFSTFAL